MARATAPLLSMTAHGDIAGILQYTRAKGQNVVRAKPITNAGSSPALLASQAKHRHAVQFYRINLLDAAIRDAWKRHATYKRHHMSGYDAAMKSMLQSYDTYSDPAHAVGITGWGLRGVMFHVQGVTSGIHSHETGAFVCMGGPSPEPIVTKGEANLYEHEYARFELAEHPWPFWVQLWKSGVPRSGILRLDPAVPQWPYLNYMQWGDPYPDQNYIHAGQYNGVAAFREGYYGTWLWSNDPPPGGNWYITPDLAIIPGSGYWRPFSSWNPVGRWRYMETSTEEFQLEAP